jgi:hypothetical protein
MQKQLKATFVAKTDPRLLGEVGDLA